MSVDRGNMSTNSAVENDHGKEGVDFYTWKYGARNNLLTQGDVATTGKPTNAEDYLPYRKYPSSLEVARLCGAMGTSVRLPFQYIGRVFTAPGVLPASLYRVNNINNNEPGNQQVFWPKEIFYRLDPVKQNQTGLWTPAFPQTRGYFPIFPMQGTMEQDNAFGSGDWLASCLPQTLHQIPPLSCHAWDIVTWMTMRHINGLQTNTESAGRITVNIDKWKQFFWQMSIPTSLRAHKGLEIALKTVNEIRKPDIVNCTYTIEEACAARSVRFLENTKTVDETDDKPDSGDKQIISGAKHKLSVKKRLARAFRKLFCCVLKN